MKQLHPAFVCLALGALLLSTTAARAQEAIRQGGRVGLSLDGGFGLAGNDTSSKASMGVLGPTLRFGGAMTDRFHVLGEFHLFFMPGPTLAGASATAFHAALDVAGQGYIGPRFFIRAGVGVGWACAVVGNTWLLPLPGPRVSGAVGYDLWRSDERSLSVSIETSYTVLYGDNTNLASLFTLGASVGFDWY